VAISLAERRFASVGDNCVDVYSGDLEGERAGGNALNVAFELLRSGWNCSYFGAVGNDARGEMIRDSANASGINTEHLITLDGPTGFTVIGHSAAGDRQFLEEDYGVAADYRIDDATAELLSEFAWIHLSRQADAGGRAAQLGSRGALLSCDFGEQQPGATPDPLCAELEVAFFSLPDGDPNTAEKLATDATEVGAGIGVVTMGPLGSIAVAEGKSWFRPAVEVAVVDSLGAGDAFIAAFIADVVSDETIADTIDAAARMGAEACTRVGLAETSHSGE
jgi:fructoselysine 6-kinase